MSNKIWVVSELYYPEDTSTGYFLTSIAEGLVKQTEVGVLCSQPTYSERGLMAPWKETRRGVEIRRCRGSRFDRSSGILRLINIITISSSIFIRALFCIQPNDHVLVVTNPPALPYLVFLACWFKKAKTFLLVHDVYPEVLKVVGLLKPSNSVYRLLNQMSRWLFKRAYAVIVIGRDMARAIEKKGRPHCYIIENWADVDRIFPIIDKGDVKLLSTLGLTKRFVVQYCGNIGKTHGVQDLLEAAQILGSDAWFLLIGSGSAMKAVRQRAEVECSNVTVLDRCAREQLCDYLNACDIAVISLVQGMSGLSVPSRMYNVMAAGKPILAIAENDSELAMVVREEKIGWVVKPGDIKGYVDAVIHAKQNPNELLVLGRRARIAATRRYSKDLILKKYSEVLIPDKNSKPG